jgi:hypothetical protein
MPTKAHRSPNHKPKDLPRIDIEGVQLEVYTAAKRYVAAGISVIPIQADGTKAPCWQLLPRRPSGEGGGSKATWKPYRERLATRAELAEWFKPGRAEYLCGIAVVCGAGSGGWETIDFDESDAGLAWWNKIKKSNRKLLSRLAFVISPRPGLHVHYRCSEVEGGHALARGYRINSETKKNELKVLVETRGEGNYIVVPPSPVQCHPSGQPYKLSPDRDLAEVQTITAEQRQLLIETAEGLNEFVRPTQARPPIRPPGPIKYSIGGRPGDDFNSRASWAEILEPHGWHLTDVFDGGTEHWCRPHKGGGISATVNYEGSDLLYVFSTSAEPFEERRGYTKFTAYAQLNHGGDFSAAAQTLRQQGYGRTAPRAIVDPFRCYREFVPRRTDPAK